MEFSHDVAQMVCLRSGPNNGPLRSQRRDAGPSREVKDISGLTHGVGWCAPSKARAADANVKDGNTWRPLVETIGCTGMSTSAAMAAEILPGKTILRRWNVDLVCDASTVRCASSSYRSSNGRTQTAVLRGWLPDRCRPRRPRQGSAQRDRNHVRHLRKGPRTWRWPRAT